MNERELIVNLVRTDDDAHYIFNVFKDNHKKGKFAFKKVRVRSLLGSKTSIDELTNSVSLTAPMTSPDLELLLQEFTKPASYTALQQYLLVRSLFPDFIKENYEVIANNAEKGLFPFAGLSAYKTSEEVESYYLHRHEEVHQALLESLSAQAVDFLGGRKGKLEFFEDLLRGNDLLDLDRLLGLAGSSPELDVDVRDCFLQEFASLKADNPMLPELEESKKSATRLFILASFLNVGNYPQKTRTSLLKELQVAFFSLNLQLISLTSGFLMIEMRKNMDEIQSKNVESQREIKKLNQKIQGFIKKSEKESQEDELLLKEIAGLKNQILEKEQALFASEEAREATDAQWERIAGVAQRETAHIKGKLKEFENMSKGYQWLLGHDFSHYEMVVIYSSPLLYARQIYPELTFMDPQTALSEPFEAKGILVQLVGMTGKQKKQIEKLAAGLNITAHMLPSIDERDLIMDIACYIKRKGEGMLHESA